jgi:hypothetical protein
MGGGQMSIFAFNAFKSLHARLKQHLQRIRLFLADLVHLGALRKIIKTILTHLICSSTRGFSNVFGVETSFELRLVEIFRSVVGIIDHPGYFDWFFFGYFDCFN